MQFLDEVKIYLKSGDGGSGAVSFRREKFIARGGPDGGNGGKGGDIILESHNNLNTLIDYRYRQHFKARNGESGMGRNRNGKGGDNIILKVPVGTQIVFDDKKTIMADFTEENQRVTLLKGGKGGLGNANFKSSINQAPRQFTAGDVGQDMWIWLKLKLISDVGLVGLPNAGKSTFLSSVSSAKPKIADYPFTTLKPQLGVAYIDESEFVIADIPGLIQGAHNGIGLGDKFLKHIERCKIILHLIDVTNEDLEENYNVINNELKKYGIKNKPEIIMLNKIDAISNDVLQDKIIKLSQKLNKDILAVSAISGLNMLKSLRIVRQVMSQEIKDIKDEDGALLARAHN